MKRPPQDWANDANFLNITISENLIVLPIPTCPLPSGFTFIVVEVNNPSSGDRWVNLHGFLPDLLDDSLEPVTRHFAQPDQCDSLYLTRIHSHRDAGSTLMFRLAWQGERLDMEIRTHFVQELRATFENLRAGEYLLRFKHYLPSGTKWKSTALESNFKTLRFVEPVGSDYGIVEVDGIQFEAIAPEEILIPSQQVESSIPVEFKLRIHNTSSIPQLFLLFQLMPEIQDSTGQVLDRSYNCNASYNPSEFDFRWLKPGEDLAFAINGEFYWYENQLHLRGYENSGGFWGFTIPAGEYWLRVTYCKRRWNRDPKYCEDNAWKLHREIWEGCVSTPVKKFRVILD